MDFECVWNANNPPRPDYLVIRRISTAEEVLVAVILELHPLESKAVNPRDLLFRQRKSFNIRTQETEIESICLFPRKSPHFLQVGQPTAEVKPLDLFSRHSQARCLDIRTIGNQQTENESICLFQRKSIHFLQMGQPTAEKDSLMELSDDFLHLLDQGVSSYADVNLKCGSVTVPAHKNILAARSPVFAAMFATVMR
ncbi:hypothetical protein CEXT_149571 [Caerostris extrusa]|uniref:BTB domain-containing protein n=1 Tax=Caerostris extrusa TaxID=172846 RepID=A0AAV4XQB0_CAEEX|nr:hypothetical protein CEXT_149571 [Caerostris extrusa]